MLFTAVREHFEDADLANLTYAVVAINSWNRLAISFRSVAGFYTSQRLSVT
jgi:alkylhydroperoxidase family enzyme